MVFVKKKQETKTGNKLANLDEASIFTSLYGKLRSVSTCIGGRVQAFNPNKQYGSRIRKAGRDILLTRRNSWPTAPEMPAIATLGPFESFSALTLREARVGRRWKAVTSREKGA